MAEINERKASKLYAAIDASDFYSNPVAPGARSWMNVPFVLADPALDAQAVFRTLRHLRTAGKLLLIFSVLPRSWTDHVYRFVASRRYKWFGRDDSCPLPDPAQKDRFLS